MDERTQALADYAKHVNAQKMRILHHAGLDIVEGKREGVHVWDVDGRRYIDCISGAGSFNVGRRNPAVVAALKAALDDLDIGVFLLCSEQKAALAVRLAGIAPGNLNQVMYGTGGGEANDFALKLARGYTMRPHVVSTIRAYHGHTGFALSAIGRDAYSGPFQPLMPEFELVPFGDLEAMRAAVTDRTAAVIVEPIQGEGGIRIPPDGYLAGLRRICDEAGALLIFDEIQTGLARTGKMWACQHEGVAPDIMTTAKSLGGSVYPISATLYREELGDFVFTHPFVHLSTFGGSDLGCVVAMTVLDEIERLDLRGNAQRMGQRFAAGFAQLTSRYPEILRETRQRGLMMGLQYTDDAMGPRMSYQLSQRGVIGFYSGNEPSVMRLMPPLVIAADEVDFVLDALDQSMAAIVRENAAGSSETAVKEGARRRRPAPAQP